MVEHLYHFLPAYHLFHIAIQLAQAGLLACEIGLAARPAVADIPKHGRITHHHQQGKPPVQHKQHGQCTHNLDKALNDHGKAVVQRIRDCVHIVGKIAHYIAMAPGIEKAKGKRLDMREQVPPDIEQHLLCHVHHRLCIAEGRQHACAVNKRRGRHTAHQGRNVCTGQAVYHRPYHIGAQQVGAGAYRDQRCHCEQQKPVPPHVAQQLAYGKAKVFGAFSAQLACHCHRLPSFGNGRSPDRWRPFAAAARACRTRAAARHPAQQSGLFPSQR